MAGGYEVPALFGAGDARLAPAIEGEFAEGASGGASMATKAAASEAKAPGSPTEDAAAAVAAGAAGASGIAGVAGAIGPVAAGQFNAFYAFASSSGESRATESRNLHHEQLSQGSLDSRFPQQQPPQSSQQRPIDATPSMRFLSSLGETDDVHDEPERPDEAPFERPSIRWADTEGSLESVNDVPATLEAARRELRPRFAIAIAAVVVLAFAASMVDSQGGFFSPAEAFACYGLTIKQFIASAVAPSDVLREADIIAAHEAYFRVLEGFWATVSTALCGIAVGVAGLLFQSSFRRNWAVAPIVGVSAAVLAGQGIALLAIGTTLGMSWIAFIVACVVGLVPPIALRFRLNVLNMPDADARQLGADARRLRALADCCGIVLLVASQVHAGPVFALALAAAPAARCLFGVEFRKALSGTALIGAAALLLARLVPVPLWIPASVISAGAVIALMLAKQRKRQRCYVGRAAETVTPLWAGMRSAPHGESSDAACAAWRKQ